MPHVLALAVEIVTTVLTVAGMAYFLASMIAARIYLRSRRVPLPCLRSRSFGTQIAQGPRPRNARCISQPLPAGLCRRIELLFGISSFDDPAVAAVERLKAEFPHVAISLIECPERLGTNGKVSTLFQLAIHARYDYLLINDSDITVSPRYLERVMACFGAQNSQFASEAARIGMVTALYRGRAHGTFGFAA